MGLVGYFDESGTHHGSRAVAFAGIIASTENWECFEGRWQRLLAKFDIESFHMSEYESRRGPYANWVDIRRLRFIRAATEAIAWNAGCLVGASVIVADYDRDVPKHLQSQVGSPYCLCVQKCLTLSVEWSRTSGDSQPVAFVFENGASQAEEVRRMYRDATTDPVWGAGLGSLSFRGKDCLPLQASDIVAYETYKQMENQKVSGPIRPVRASLWPLVRQVDFRSGYFDRDSLPELVSKRAAGCPYSRDTSR